MTVLRWTALLVGCSVSFALPGAGASPEQTEPRIDLALRNLPLPPPVDGLYGLPDGGSRGRQLYLQQLTREAQAQGLPPALADAVASVESGYDSNARGTAGEIGLMQILPSTAAMLGHTGGIVELLKPETNIRYGVLYLAQAWRLANGDLCRSLMKYRAGHGEERMSPLSLQYCARARAHLASVGSALADAPVPAAVVDLPVAAPGSAPAKRSIQLASIPTGDAVAPGRQRTRSAADSRRFWAAHEARIRKISARLESRWRKTAQN